jgi:hypothetical protein
MRHLEPPPTSIGMAYPTVIVERERHVCLVT